MGNDKAIGEGDGFTTFGAPPASEVPDSSSGARGSGTAESKSLV